MERITEHVSKFIFFVFFFFFSFFFSKCEGTLRYQYLRYRELTIYFFLCMKDMTIIFSLLFRPYAKNLGFHPSWSGIFNLGRRR